MGDSTLWATSLLLLGAFFIFGALLVKRTKSFGFFLTLSILYGYSIHMYLVAEIYWAIGAKPFWFSYPYYFEKNHAFYKSFFLNCFFCAGYASLLWWQFRKRPRPLASPFNANEKPKPQPAFWVACAGAFAGFLYLWGPYLLNAISSCQSLYYAYKRGFLLLGNSYVLSRIFFDYCALSVCYLVAYQLLKKLKPVSTSVLAGGAILLLFGIASILGDKLSLGMGILFSAALFIQSKKSFVLGLLLIGLSVLALNWINVIRSQRLVYCGLQKQETLGQEKVALLNRLAKNFSMSPRVSNQILQEENADTSNKAEQLFAEKFNTAWGRSIIQLFDHTELLATFSTYIVVNKKIPSFDGGSLRFLFSSLIPRFLGKERPLDPYTYFATKAGILDETGWGLGYLADWLMNFGMGGVLIGLLLLVQLHAFAYRASLNSFTGQFIFAAFVSYFPMLIRGPMDFKSLFYHTVLCLFLRASCSNQVRLQRKPFGTLLRRAANGA